MTPDNEMAENNGQEGRVLDEKGNATGQGPGEAMHSSPQGVAHPMTFGEKLVGVDFNPAGSDKVKRLNQIFAEAADIVMDHKSDHLGDPYLINTLKGHAIREILNGQMAAVKHVTNRH
jgi:hypothetical protein